MTDPRSAMARLRSVWDRAGTWSPPAERQPPGMMRTAFTRTQPYLVIHIEPPFPRQVGDPCAIAVVGRGDGEHQLEDVRYHVLGLGLDAATGATRLELTSHTAGGEIRTHLEDVPADVPGFLERCVAIAAGRAPASRDQAPAIAPWYWWHAARGADAMRAFCAAPEHDAWNVVHQHPILLLPEIVLAAEQVLGPSHATVGLRQMHRSLRGTPYFVPFHRLLAAALGDERGGSPRVNLERALAVMAEVRGAIAELGAPGDELAHVDACEARLRERLAALRGGGQAAPAAAPVDPAWSALFLDGNELPGFRRDELGLAIPQAEDFVFSRHGGVASGAVSWIGGDDSPVHRVVDTRWLFPSARAAAAFVQSILPATGEGLASVPIRNVGDAAYGWGDTRPARAAGPRDARQVALVRVGRMVARLEVTEGPNAARSFQTLVHAMVLPYLEAIVKRGRRALSRYWLAVAGGAEAAAHYVRTPPRRALQLFSQYPILLLPELPSAMAWLGDAYRAPAESLVTLQASLRNDWRAYRDVLRALVRALLDDPAGQPVVNADTALALVVHHRCHDPDYSWAALEAECRARVAGGSTAAPSHPAHGAGPASHARRATG